MIRRSIFLLAFCTGLLSIADVYGKTTVEVTPDRTQMRADEEFKVRFSVESTEGVRSPDWSPLKKNFSIRQGGKQLRSSHVNGVNHVVNEWDMYLQPKYTGELKIPSIKFGTVWSKAVDIKVQLASQSGGKTGGSRDFFVEVKATPTDPYVQQQVLFTLTVFMGHSLRGSISPPQSNKNAIVEGLGDARKYRQRRDGRNYEVYQMKHLIYPQSSGRLEINPVTLTGSYTRGNRRFPVNRKSRSLVLDVKQVPPSFPGKFWLPAEQLTLEEKWLSDPSSWQAGDPVKRRLKLWAKGLLARQLPEVELVDINGFRVYVEPADFKNLRSATAITGVVERSAVLIPAQAGVYTVPGFRLPWWNTKTDSLEFAELADETVTIGEAAFGSLVVEKQDALAPSVTELSPSAPDTTTTRSDPWFWASVVFLLGWLVTGVMMMRGSIPYQKLRFLRERKNNVKALRGALRKACLEKNDAAQAKDALLRWSELVWPDNPPTSVGEIGRRCGGEIEQRVGELNQALYGAAGSGWRGSALWESVDRQGLISSEAEKESVTGLRSLHKI